MNTFSHMLSATVHMTESQNHHASTNSKSKPAKISDFFPVVFALEIYPSKRTQSTEISHLASSFSCVIVLSIHSIDSFICFCLFQF